MAELVLGVDEDKTIGFDVWNIGLVVHVINDKESASIMLSNSQVKDLKVFINNNYKETK